MHHIRAFFDQSGVSTQSAYHKGLKWINSDSRPKWDPYLIVPSHSYNKPSLVCTQPSLIHSLWYFCFRKKKIPLWVILLILLCYRVNNTETSVTMINCIFCIQWHYCSMIYSRKNHDNITIKSISMEGRSMWSLSHTSRSQANLVCTCWRSLGIFFTQG